MRPLLDNISIVLVDTKTPANIGATARCMMNMGLSTLLLVNPPKDRDGEARKLAAGADALIANGAVFSSLADAIADHGFVIGTSRHAGKQRKNIRTPRDAAEIVVPLLAHNRVAIVFGNEVNGLENSDLALCHEIVAIPASEEFPSLNLSHAVMVMAYELFTASNASSLPSSVELARTADVEDLYRHLQKTLQAIGFLEQDHPERMMFSFRQIFGRARLNSRDVSMLRGVLSAVDRAICSGKRN
jgi:tRNA/rRNA methyltransferase